MTRYPTREERTARAFRGYLELLDAVDWLKAEVRVPLASFGLTLGEFRTLHLLYREGALPMMEVSRRRRSERHNLAAMIARLEGFGWARRAVVTLPPVEFERAHLPKSRQHEKRRGRRLIVVGMTAQGKKFLGQVLSIHSKLVKALMLALNAREQDSLFRICRKLREGDIVKFVREMTHEDDD
jgi:DNA-binding MarR family transcriptional regulator